MAPQLVDSGEEGEFLAIIDRRSPAPLAGDNAAGAAATQKPASGFRRQLANMIERNAFVVINIARCLGTRRGWP